MVGADKMQPLGTRLGSYEIIRPLAKGGMAELFLARNTGPEGFEKVLVLKKILPHYAENPRFVRSFLDEAKLVAGFDHPHIAHVYDMGTADGAYFFTMELVHGVDCRTIMKRTRREKTPMPFELAILIVRNIASALHYAHERRGSDGRSLDIVHRDVSPSNIIVSYDGVPKLVDFGIAKATSSSMKTQTGALKGKIAYMSPEQAKGAPIDRRTDVYALGIILWELVANRRLYKGDNDMATIQRIIYEPAHSPREHRRDCPPGLERIILRALSQDIDKRYQTAEALQIDLEDFALENKWKQSASLLGAELKKNFAAELRQWEVAQADPVTVTDLAGRLDDAPTRRIVLPEDPSDDDDDSVDHDAESVAPTVSKPLFQTPLAPPPASPRRAWKWLAAIAVIAIAVGVTVGVATTGDELPIADSAQPATAVPAAPPIADPAPPPAPEIEMPADVAADLEKPAKKPAIKPKPPTVKAKAVEAKRVEKPKPQDVKPKPEPKPEAPKPEAPKPKPKFDPNAVFPPSS